MEDNQDAEIKKHLWTQYLLARMFATQEPVEEFKYVPVQQAPESRPMEGRFQALREKLEQAKEDSGSDGQP